MTMPSPAPWLDAVLIGWFVLTALSVAYVAWDAFTRNPELRVMKWGWLLVTLYGGPIMAAAYVLSCQEPANERHEDFVRPLWKQAFGSAIHCMAGDATGVIAAAAITTALGKGKPVVTGNKELLANVSIKVEPTDSPEQMKVFGRGELQLSILIEMMRREGYELQVSRPEIVVKEVNGVKVEPVEDLVIDVADDYQGVVIAQVGIMLMGVVDTAMVGRVSADAVAAVALGHIYWVNISIPGIGLLMALDPVVSQAVGAADRDGVRRGVQRLKQMGVRSIAVMYLFSFVNPRHELRTREIIAEEFPDVDHVSLSHEVNPEWREYERTASTVAGPCCAN